MTRSAPATADAPTTPSVPDDPSARLMGALLSSAGLSIRQDVVSAPPKPARKRGSRRRRAPSASG